MCIEEGMNTTYLLERPGLYAFERCLVAGKNFQGRIKVVQRATSVDQSSESLFLTLSRYSSSSDNNEAKIQEYSIAVVGELRSSSTYS